jgi:hypothetical protein
MIFRSAPLMERAKGPCMRQQPAGLETREVANSFKTDSKWAPRSPRWFIAKGTNRLVALCWTGPRELASTRNFLVSASLMTKSELVIDLDKHDFFNHDVMTRSITVSFRCMPCAIA